MRRRHGRATTLVEPSSRRGRIRERVRACRVIDDEDVRARRADDAAAADRGTVAGNRGFECAPRRATFFK